MKISLIGEPKIIMSNPLSKHNYFGWPSVARLKNGKIAAVASGFRLRHVCPFGKTVIAYSEDEAETYTLPAPVVDTPLDDRDGGICPFGESSVVVTSFNNTADYQRRKDFTTEAEKAYTYAYLDLVSPEEEAQCLGTTFRISHDNGTTFGPLLKSPITSPHGPLELSDGTLLWVGRSSSFNGPQEDLIYAYAMDAEGKMEYRGSVEPICHNGEKQMSCEPHAIRLPDGRILCHIRVQGEHHIRAKDPKGALFTLYQTLSEDEGRTWSKPEQVLSDQGGAPAHLLLHSSGILISAYGCRRQPDTGINVMLSKDLGKTWETDFVLNRNGENKDLGYPSTVELKDGSLATVYYDHPDPEGPAVILQQKWKIEE